MSAKTEPIEIPHKKKHDHHHIDDYDPEKYHLGNLLELKLKITDLVDRYIDCKISHNIAKYKQKLVLECVSNLIEDIEVKALDTSDKIIN